MVSTPTSPSSSMTMTNRRTALESSDSAGGGIRTHEPLRDEVLSLAPLTRLGDPRVVLSNRFFGLIILKD
jgi:hypothetical protein